MNCQHKKSDVVIREIRHDVPVPRANHLIQVKKGNHIYGETSATHASTLYDQLKKRHPKEEFDLIDVFVTWHYHCTLCNEVVERTGDSFTVLNPSG